MLAYFRDLYGLIREYRKAVVDERAAIAEWRHQLHEDIDSGR